MTDVIIGVTGHRPQRLNSDSVRTRGLLYRFALKWLKSLRPAEVVTGMALGWDTAIAEAAHVLGIPFTAAVPFKGQESKWRDEDQRTYNLLLGAAKRIEIVSKGGYSPQKLMVRNLWIVDNSDKLVALWDGNKTGGTWNAVQAALEVDQDVLNLWNEWLDFYRSSRLTGR